MTDVSPAGDRAGDPHRDLAPSNSFRSRARRGQRLAAVMVWGLLVVSYIYYFRSRGLSPLTAAEQLKTVLVENWWGPALFVLAYVVRPLVLFPASVLTILGGLAFGLYWGTTWTVVASNLSTLAAYGVGRYFLSGGLGDKLLALTGRLGTRAQRHPFEATAIMRLVYLPFDAVGYLGGFLRLRLAPFMAGSMLGTLPGTVAFVGFGASIESLDDGTPAFDFRILAASLLLVVAGSMVKSRVAKRYVPESTNNVPAEPEAA